MRTNDEMRGYLNYLVGHERDCFQENCPLCRSAQNVYESVRKMIFSEVSFPHVTITARREAALAVSVAGAARKTAAKKAA